VLGLTDLQSVVPWPRKVVQEHRHQRDDHEGDELEGYKEVMAYRVARCLELSHFFITAHHKWDGQNNEGLHARILAAVCCGKQPEAFPKLPQMNELGCDFL
jgi:hypothetical protein